MNDTTMDSFIARAALVSNLGFKIFPVVENKKIPQIVGWQDASTCDPNQIHEWGQLYPNANVGINCDKSGLVVVDIDVKNGKSGYESLENILPADYTKATFAVSTPSGGMHLYYTSPSKPVGNKVGVVSGVDIRGAGGYVVGPGSSIDGANYEIVNEFFITDLPDEVVELLAGSVAHSTPHVPMASINEGAVEGSRNDSTFRYACSLRAKGITLTEATYLITQFAASCTPPFPQSEALICLKSAWGYTSAFPLTDVGNAKRLTMLAGGDFRYCPERRRWLFWTGFRWSVDEQGKVSELSKAVIDVINVEARNCNED